MFHAMLERYLVYVVKKQNATFIKLSHSSELHSAVAPNKQTTLSFGVTKLGEQQNLICKQYKHVAAV